MKTSNTGAAISRDPIVTACPDCGAFVKLPSCVNIEAVVQCPSCDDRFPVRALLPEAIPDLIVVRDEDVSSHKDHSFKVGETNAAKQLEIVASVPSLLEVPDILRKGAKRRRRSSGKPRVESPNSESPRSGERDESRRKRKKSKRNRTSHTWAEENRRQSGSRKPVVEFVKVVLGGLLALPVAQIIIWWMIGMDPLRIAPTVSNYVPIVVPPKLRPADQGQPVTGVGIQPRSGEPFNLA